MNYLRLEERWLTINLYGNQVNQLFTNITIMLDLCFNISLVGEDEWVGRQGREGLATSVPSEITVFKAHLS